MVQKSGQDREIAAKPRVLWSGSRGALAGHTDSEHAGQRVRKYGLVPSRERSVVPDWLWFGDLIWAFFGHRNSLKIVARA